MKPVLEAQRGGDARIKATGRRDKSSGQASPTVWTLGHSTRPLPEFLELLERYRIEALADVRRFPASRRHPQYAATALAAVLTAHGIEYRWLPELGGRRKPRPDSPHTAWRNASFRGYADHMDTTEFSRAFDELLELAQHRRTAIMCAEALWWRCHRALIADALRTRGFEVVHIFDGSHSVVHPFTSAARIVDGRVSYEAAPSEPRRARPRRSR